MPIQIDRLDDTDIGRFVEYRSLPDKSEFGRIKSWNDKWVFVVYRKMAMALNWKSYTGAATNPADLWWGTRSR